MKYVKGSVFPYTEENLRQDNPNTSFPLNALSDESIRSDFGVEEVGETDKPSRKGYKAVASGFETVAGKNVETWDLVPKTREEIGGDDIEVVPPPERLPGHRVELGEPEFVDGVWKETYVNSEVTWLDNRLFEYGGVPEQIEYITENGLEAWQTKVADIKTRYPKDGTNGDPTLV